MKWFLIVFALAGLSGSAQSQVDSARVRSLLKKVGERFASADGRQQQLDSALSEVNQVLGIVDTVHVNEYMFRTFCLQSEYYLRSNRNEDAKRVIFRLIGLCHAGGFREREARAWFFIGGMMVFHYSEYDESVVYLENAARIYKSIPGKELNASQVMTAIADRLIERGDFDKAESTLLAVLAYHQSYPNVTFDDKRYVHFLLAELYRYKGAFNKALENALASVRIIETTGDSTDCEMYYGQLAMVYQELEQHDNSIAWFRKTLEKREERHFPIDNLYRTTGFLIQELIKKGQGREALLEIGDLARRHPPVTANDSACLSQSRAYCYDALGQYRFAEIEYLALKKEYERLGMKGELLLIADYDIGSFFVRQGQFKRARPYFNQALVESKAFISRPSSVRDIHFMLYRIDSAAGDYLSAIHHFTEFKAISDTLINQKKSREMAEMLVKYEAEKKDKDLLLQQKNILLLTRQTVYEAAGIVLLLIIVLLLFNRYRIRQKNSRVLEAQQKEINDKNIHLQDLLYEKEWLLKEIHHRVKNNLQMIMSLLSSQSVYLENDAALFAIRDSQRRVQAISLIHQKLYQTDNVSAINMPIYIRDLVEYIRDSFTMGPSIRFTLDIGEIELDVSHAVPLGLILNEAITNAIKYAFPGGQDGIIRIGLQQDAESNFLLTITDNGVGMPAGIQTRKAGSLGMSLMRGLSEELGGSFDISGHEGTRITITFQNIVHE